jgi:hypothetical protein
LVFQFASIILGLALLFAEAVAGQLATRQLVSEQEQQLLGLSSFWVERWTVQAAAATIAGQSVERLPNQFTIGVVASCFLMISFIFVTHLVRTRS